MRYGKVILLCLALLISGLILIACKSENREAVKWNTELNAINNKHSDQAKKAPVHEINRYIRNLEEFDIGFTEDELISLTSSYGSYCHPTNMISKEAAIQDIDLLFRLFYFCYAPYEYFGGNEAFLAAKDSILEDIRGHGDDFPIQNLIDSMHKHLAFIEDGHFAINNENTFEHQMYYFSEEVSLYTDDAGYFWIEENEKHYLDSVNEDSDLDKWLKLSISPEGELVYYIGILSFESYDGAGIVLKSKENAERRISLCLSKPELTYDASKLYDEDWASSIAYCAVRTFYDSSVWNDIRNSASSLASRKTAVLDIRGNRGGDGNALKEWLDIYNPQIGNSFLGVGVFYLISRADSYIRAKYMEYHNEFFTVSPEDNQKALMDTYKNKSNRDIVVDLDELSFIKNDSLLFLLMDNVTASSGEAMAAGLRRIENTVVVGTNTSGCMTGGSGTYTVLPNSKIGIYFGSMLALYYDKETFNDAKGLEPDLWVGEDALERVNALIAYYGL